MAKNRIIRLLFSTILVFAGALGIVVKATGRMADLLHEGGQALLVAGVFAVFMETVLARSKKEDRQDYCQGIAAEVHRLLAEKPVEPAGLRCVASVRERFEGYSTWAKSRDTQEHFFAGRSVLHRIDADFQENGLGSAEDVIARRLAEGARFQIVFLDPTSDLVEELAIEEGQRPEEMMADLAYSIGVVERLHDKLMMCEGLPSEARLTIRVSNKNPWFSYHRVDDELIVGFYFVCPIRHRSAAYEAVDPITQELFDSHVAALWSLADETTLLDVNSHRNRIRMDLQLLKKLTSRLHEQLGMEEATRLLKGERRRPPGPAGHGDAVQP